MSSSISFEGNTAKFDLAPDVWLQLKHRTAILKITGSNAVEALRFLLLIAQIGNSMVKIVSLLTVCCLYNISESITRGSKRKKKAI